MSICIHTMPAYPRTQSCLGMCSVTSRSITMQLNFKCCHGGTREPSQTLITLKIRCTCEWRRGSVSAGVLGRNSTCMYKRKHLLYHNTFLVPEFRQVSHFLVPLYELSFSMENRLMHKRVIHVKSREVNFEISSIKVLLYLVAREASFRVLGFYYSVRDTMETYPISTIAIAGRSCI